MGIMLYKVGGEKMNRKLDKEIFYYLDIRKGKTYKTTLEEVFEEDIKLSLEKDYPNVYAEYLTSEVISPLVALDLRKEKEELNVYSTNPSKTKTMAKKKS